MQGFQNISNLHYNILKNTLKRSKKNLQKINEIQVITLDTPLIFLKLFFVRKNVNDTAHTCGCLKCGLRIQLRMKGNDGVGQI